MKLLLKPFSYLWHHKKILAALIVLGILAFIFYPRPKPIVATQKAVRKQFVQSVSVSGTINARRTVNLTFPISGKITWVGIKKGDNVIEGQALASLDVATAQKNLKAALISYSLQRNSFDQTQVNNQSRTPDQALTDDMKRILQNNQFNLDQAVNSVELQDVARRQSVLTTPIAGIVTRADTELPGPDALAGSTTFTVTDPTSLVFDVDVDQADIGKVKEGMPMKVVFDAYPNDTVGRAIDTIDYASHTTSNGGNAYTVETKLPSDMLSQYRVGMNGSADIILLTKDNVLTVPLSSIQDNLYVYIKKTKGFEKRKISVGLQNDTDAEVLGGLSEGEQVALSVTDAAKQVRK